MVTKPVDSGIITSTFQDHKNRSPKGSWGIDIGSVQPFPVKIRAAYPGIVYAAGLSETFGNRVWVHNTDGEAKGFYTIYPHLDSIDSRIVPNKLIKEGDIIGIMGNTGLIMVNGSLQNNNDKHIALPIGRHLHFENRTLPDVNGVSIEPKQIIKLYTS